ncbi:cerebral dopamine neurotrophic factor isoform X2 [Alligator mississippiensis]|uniref:Cerebral dopamine neurotrophic factor isoform A n=1 Tax=Alligator mississippiensis TaxID=8496 RepID=A0A151NPI3_ALLMI|nr:cerebral dopamine neurotrophic factor isoform X2 [Alligator mississippiensis]KYO38731.1 cerebral dopamine neurotrophic factor isoform A [Alligator mississippiensis]
MRPRVERDGSHAPWAPPCTCVRAALIARFAVCKEFLDKFYNSLKEKHSDFTVAAIEEALLSSCKTAKGKEQRLCYYIGAISDAPTKIISEVSRPMSAHVPVPKICDKLKKIDIQICELKYERKLDLTSVDLSKMRVAELRKILDSWGEVCKACIEKTEFVNLIKELAPKYAPPNSRADL